MILLPNSIRRWLVLIKPCPDSETNALPTLPPSQTFYKICTYIGIKFFVLYLDSKFWCNLIGFAKLPNFGEDLYSSLVAPSIQSNLRVESWQNGKNKIKSDCKSNFSIMNIQEIDFDRALKTSGIKFRSSKGIFRL